MNINEARRVFRPAAPLFARRVPYLQALNLISSTASRRILTSPP